MTDFEKKLFMLSIKQNVLFYMDLRNIRDDLRDLLKSEDINEIKEYLQIQIRGIDFYFHNLESLNDDLYKLL